MPPSSYGVKWSLILPSASGGGRVRSRHARSVEFAEPVPGPHKSRDRHREHPHHWGRGGGVPHGWDPGRPRRLRQRRRHLHRADASRDSARARCSSRSRREGRVRVEVVVDEETLEVLHGDDLIKTVSRQVGGQWLQVPAGDEALTIGRLCSATSPRWRPCSTRPAGWVRSSGSSWAVRRPVRRAGPSARSSPDLAPATHTSSPD